MCGVVAYDHPADNADACILAHSALRFRSMHAWGTRSQSRRRGCRYNQKHYSAWHMLEDRQYV
eukprot:6135422-Pleurochrysis_carterae.AAC.1